MGATIIESKLIPPPLPPAHAARPRVNHLLSELLSRRGVVWVCATAGAGKTTAAVEATQGLASSLAWLTLDDTDAAPGRLLVYLEAALARVDPEAAGAATSALAAGMRHREAAGLLGAAIRAPTILVIDELERLAGQRSALGILSALRRHARRDRLRLLLISRRDVALDVESRPADIAWVTEGELAFTVEEAASALEQAGAREVDPQAAVAAVGGWVTGVLFEAWRSDEHVAGRGGEADPLNGYLATQILGELEPTDVELLETCAVLDRVDAARAGRLGVPDADAWLRGLRTRHLPVTWSDHGASLSFHPRLREYLLERLERRDKATRQRVRLQHGRLLADEGHHEEAANELLLAASHDEARTSVEAAIGNVVDRLDFAIAELWLTSLGGRGSSLELTAAEVMLALGQDQYRRGAAVGDALACGGRDALISSRPGVASMLAWCYFHVGRIDKVIEIYELVRDAPEGELIHELLTLADRDQSRLVITRRRSEPLDGLLLRLHWSHGRLRELDEAPLSRWAAAVGDPWRLAALRASGRLAEALEQLDALHRSGELTGLQELIGAEVYIDADCVDDARASLARGRAKVELTGSAFLTLLGLLIEVRLEIRSQRDLDRARVLLDALDEHPAASSYRWITEQADALRGFLALLNGEDDLAVRILRPAVASMVAGQRLLEVPAAAVYLAEAEWRCGDEDAADRAVDLALDTAELQGADHLLLTALADFPPVLARRLDAVVEPDSRWHGLARALVVKGAIRDLPVGARVHLADFGAPALEVDGQPRALRLTKSMELVAYVGVHSPQTIDRRSLLDALFDGRADKSVRSYLRQALREVRTALPELLEEDETRISLRPGVIVASDSLRFERSLAEAAGLRGEERLKRLSDSLALMRGDYLACSSSAWSERRREELRSKATQARFEAAEIAYQFGRYAQADTLLRVLLFDDPLREEAWRLRIRLDHALADFDAVLKTYRSCQESLATIGLEPAPSTRRLVEELRA